MNAPQDPLARVVAWAAATPLGRSAEATAAAVRAGISLFAEHPSLRVDSSGGRAVVAAASWLDGQSERNQRLVALARGAWEDLTPQLDALGLHEPLPVFLALPEPRPGWDTPEVAALRDELAGVFAREGQTPLLTVFADGHAGGQMALAAAIQALQAAETSAVVVGGLDSYLDWRSMLWLDENDQLHNPRNSWGFVPGEAAGLIVLTRPDPLADAAAIVLRGLGQGQEPNAIKTQTVCTGNGLGDAIRAALAPLAACGSRAHYLVGDLNGEPYRADELGFALMRVREQISEAVEIHTPAESWGDVGAASLPLFVVLVAEAFRKHYAPDSRALCWASSESGLRGAILLEYQKPQSAARSL